MDASRIQERLLVVGADGGHVGEVDHLEGQRIKLTRTDPSAEGKHYFIHIDAIVVLENSQGAIETGRCGG